MATGDRRPWRTTALGRWAEGLVFPAVISISAEGRWFFPQVISISLLSTPRAAQPLRIRRVGCRGGALVVVESSDEWAERGMEILQRLHPVNMHERMAQGRQEG